MLRWVTPVMYFRRTATRDTELRGQKIREEGRRSSCTTTSANRDEDVFPRPRHGSTSGARRTSTSRSASGSTSASATNLARLEIRVIFEEMVRRMPDIALAGPVRRLRSNFINGYKSIPVRFTPEKRA